MTNYLGWDIGIACTSVYDSDGFPGIQLDVYGDNVEGTQPYEMHSPHGLYSIPLDPEVVDGVPTKGCTTLYATEGARGHAFVQGDPRVIVKLPILQKGESILYNSFGQFIRIDKEGVITLFSTDDGTTEGNSVYFQVARDAFRWVAPWGQLTFDMTGFHLLHASGARFDIGGIYGVPGAGKLSSYVSMQADAVDFLGSMISHGASNDQKNMTYAQPLIGILTSLLNITSQLAGIVSPIVGVSGTGAPAGALVAQLQTIEGTLQTIIADAMSS